MVREVSTLGEFNMLLGKTGSMLVVVMFKATWCGYCKAVMPEFSRLEAMNPGVLFLNVDVSVNKETASVYAVKSVPIFKFFKNGQLIHTIEGANTTQLRHDIMRFQR